MAVKAYHKVQCSNLKVQSNTVIKDYFKIEKNPKKGLLPLEWVMLGYMAITVFTMLFTFTKVVNPESMLWGRLRILVMTLALWGVYRMIPCRITKMVRIIAQIALLAWWYPDTYEINRMFPNLDHLFAGWEQDLFGCQPALLFAKALPWAVVSELMSMGYFMYYPMIAAVVLYYFFCRYYEAERVSFVMLASFFIYYLIYIYVPVGTNVLLRCRGSAGYCQGYLPGNGRLLQYPYQLSANPRLYRRNFLPARRGCQGSRRATYRRLPEFARGRKYHLYAPCLAQQKPQAALHHAAILHLPVYGYRVYPGALSHRCHRRMDLCRSHLLHADGSIKEHEMMRHGRYRKEIILIHQT